MIVVVVVTVIVIIVVAPLTISNDESKGATGISVAATPVSLAAEVEDSLMVGGSIFCKNSILIDNRVIRTYHYTRKFAAIESESELMTIGNSIVSCNPLLKIDDMLFIMKTNRLRAFPM